MQRAEEKFEIPTYTNCTICFVHVYDETLPLARVRDHDNYEEKHVQDIITNFFLQSDSGLYTNTCHVTRMGEEDRTLLYVMDSSKFDKVSFVSIAKLKESSIVVTNCRPSQEWMRCFARHGIQCVFPEEK